MKTILTTLAVLFSLSSIQAQWKEVETLEGGDNNCIIIDQDGIYGWVLGLGIVHSVDTAKNWSTINPNTDSYQTNLKKEKNILLYKKNGAVIRLSVDTGSSFQNITYASNLVDVEVFCGKIFTANSIPSTMVYTSVDSGLNWTNQYISGLQNPNFAKSKDKIYLYNHGSGLGELYCSTDTGANWNFLSNIGLSYIVNLIPGATGDTIFAVSVLDKAIKFSLNSGSSWSDLNLPSVISFYSKPCFINNSDTLYFNNSDSLFVSYDFGSTWQFKCFNPGLSPKAVAIVGRKLIYASGNHSFFEINIDSFISSPKSKGIHKVTISDIAVKGDSVFIAAHNLIYFSYDKGVNWSNKMPYNNNDPVNFKLVLDSNGIYASSYSTIIRSPDWGQSWLPVVNYASTYSILPFGDSIFLATANGVKIVSKQGGAVLDYGTYGYDIYKLALLNNQLVGLAKSNILSTIISTNPNWIPMNNGLPGKIKYNLIISTDTAFFIGDGTKGIYRCYPPSNTWVYTGMYNKGVRDIYANRNTVYSVSNTKRCSVLRNFQGSKWDPINFGFNGFGLANIAASDSEVYASTLVAPGLWKRKLTNKVISSVEEEGTSLALDDIMVFPNPAESIVTFTLDQPSASQELKIYNSVGQIQFKKSFNESGTFEFELNIQNFKNGNYIIELNAGGRIYKSEFIVVH